MSGIVGVVNTDDAPIDRALLDALTSSLGFRGPDGQRVWIDGHVGFGHALLAATTDEGHRDEQPRSVDQNAWIVADARIDARDDLRSALEDRIQRDLTLATDAELILHAYEVWDEACVDHLIGDFAFAIWDRRQRRLLCVRDQLGVKPFFYATVGSHVLFSNTIQCLRRHPAVSDTLNDTTVADYLINYYNRDPSSSIFRDIHRVPPAHLLTWEAGAPRLRRYWNLTQPSPVRFRRAVEYVDQFTSIFRAAVSDRLRTDRAGVLMSGGLDSPAVAATAQAILASQSRTFDLRAYTSVFDRLIPDQERHFASLVAQHLDIPIHFVAGDDCLLYGGPTEVSVVEPEPLDEPLSALHTALFGVAAANARVVLTGQDADATLVEWPAAYVRDRLARGELMGLVADVLRSFRWARRLPHLGLRSTLFAKPPATPPASPLPDWINPAFAKRLQLDANWRNPGDPDPGSPVYPLRPRFSRIFAAGMWPKLFEWHDPGFTGLPVEFRHPFLDVRLLNYVLAIPVLPWCDEKTLSRVAMRGVLPVAVLNRPKSPVPGDPVGELLRSSETSWLDSFTSDPALGEYVDRTRIRPISGEAAAIDRRPFTLNRWMQSHVTKRNADRRKRES